MSAFAVYCRNCGHEQGGHADMIAGVCAKFEPVAATSSPSARVAGPGECHALMWDGSECRKPAGPTAIGLCEPHRRAYDRMTREASR